MISENIIKLLKPLTKDDVVFLQSTKPLAEKMRHRILEELSDIQCRIVILPDWLRVVDPPVDGQFSWMNGCSQQTYDSHSFSERTKLCLGCGIPFDSLRAYKETCKETCKEIEKSLQPGHQYAIMADRREDERRQKNFESHTWGRNSVGRIGCRVCNTPQDEEAARLNDCQTIAGLM